MPKQYPKHNATSSSASIANTDAQTTLSVSGAVVYNRGAIMHGAFQASVVYVWSPGCGHPRICQRYVGFWGGLRSLHAFNSASDVKWILKAWAYRSKGKYSRDLKKLFSPLIISCCCSRWSRRRPGASIADEGLLGKGADEESGSDYPA